jgi:hypothetical protein
MIANTAVCLNEVEGYPSLAHAAVRTTEANYCILGCMIAPKKTEMYHHASRTTVSDKQGYDP